MFYIFASGSLVIAACKKMYGMPVDTNFFITVKTITEDDQPIKGLSVKLIQQNDTIREDITNANGNISYDLYFMQDAPFSLFIEDVDGEENLGTFLSENVALTESDTTVVKMTKQ